MNTCEKPTRALAEFIAGLRYEDIPPEVIDYAKDLMADALSGALAGMVFAKKSAAGSRVWWTNLEAIPCPRCGRRERKHPPFAPPLQTPPWDTR